MVVSLNIVDREILDLEEFYMGEEREARQGLFELHVGGFWMRRTRAAVPHSARARLRCWVEGRGTATMMLKWATMSSSTLFLTGIVSLDVEDSLLRSEQMQHRWSGSANYRG